MTIFFRSYLGLPLSAFLLNFDVPKEFIELTVLVYIETAFGGKIRFLIHKHQEMS
jgi:hypothetical protein